MSVASRWNLRSENDCLFVDDTSLRKVVLQHNARPGMMPYIHPLRTADGSICLTADSPWHHPHQHGIQLAFTDVNGCDFWHYPGQRPNQVVGLIQAEHPAHLGNGSPALEDRDRLASCGRQPCDCGTARLVVASRRRFALAGPGLDAPLRCGCVHRTARVRRIVRPYAVSK